MAPKEYDHWNEEADIVWAAENDFDSPMADMTDDEIKESVYKRDDYYDDHPPDGCE